MIYGCDSGHINSVNPCFLTMNIGQEGCLAYGNMFYVRCEEPTELTTGNSLYCELKARRTVLGLGIQTAAKNWSAGCPQPVFQWLWEPWKESNSHMGWGGGPENAAERCH